MIYHKLSKVQSLLKQFLQLKGYSEENVVQQ